MSECADEWESIIASHLLGEKKCFVGGVGDATNGYLFSHVWSKDENSITEEEKEEREKWKYLYSEESYFVETLTDDAESEEKIEICETLQLKEALESTLPPAQGIHIGGKKYRVVMVESFPCKSYADVYVKAVVIALGSVAGCIATYGGYYVIALIDTKEVQQKNLALELACDMAAYLAMCG